MKRKDGHFDVRVVMLSSIGRTHAPSRNTTGTRDGLRVYLPEMSGQHDNRSGVQARSTAGFQSILLVLLFTPESLGLV